MNLSDDAKAVIALTTRLGDGTRPSLSPTRWHHFAQALADASLAPAEIFAKDFDPSLPGVPDDIADVVLRLLADAAAATVAASDLATKGIWTATIVDDDYPSALIDRLGKLSPPVIFGVGPKVLLAERGLGIVGSRDVADEGAAAAQAVAHAAVEAGLTVVSGGARGVDQLAMNAAYAAGGKVIGVLADSLQARIRKPDILRALDSGNTTLVTQQAPASGFTPASAMARNKQVYALSDATVVIASDHETGGTWAGAVEALKANNGIVAVWRGPGEGPGNRHLEALGAVPVSNAEQVLASLDVEPAAQPEQLSLTD